MFWKHNCSHFQLSSVQVHSANSWSTGENEPEPSKNLFLEKSHAPAGAGKDEVGLCSKAESERGSPFIWKRALRAPSVVGGAPDPGSPMLSHGRVSAVISYPLPPVTQGTTFFWKEPLGACIGLHFPVARTSSGHFRSAQRIFSKFLLHAQHGAVYLKE